MFRLHYFLLSLLFLFPQQLSASECVHKYSKTSAQVLEVSDYGTLVLSDNRTVRLAGVVLPFVPAEVANAKNWPNGIKSIEKIRNWLVGKNIQLHLSDMKRDRYGIWPAYVYLSGNGKKIWVQSRLVSEGTVRVSSINYKYECLKQLLEVEHVARKANLGLWAYEAYRVRFAEDIWGLMRLVDRFQIVEGKVIDVVEVKGRVYLNFGRNWRKDFTVKISKGAWGRFKEKGLSLNSFKGKRVRVRGWIQLRNGPLIEVKHPDLIEVIDKNKKKAQPTSSISTDW